MDVDVLISGGTHRCVAPRGRVGDWWDARLLTWGWDRFEAFEEGGRFFVNPGSATGAFSPLWTPPPPPSTVIAASSAPTSPPPSTAAPDLKPDTAQPSNGTALASDDATRLAPPISAAASAPSSTYPPEPTPSFALLDIQGTVVVRRSPGGLSL